MSLNSITSAERLHIAFFGLRNAGKSSLVNAVTGQNLSLVSNVLGTTTDPVKKAMELLPLGPVVIIDTPGFDDDGELGLMRVESAKAVLTHTDIVVLVVDATTGKTKKDTEFQNELEAKNIPFIVAYNKCDLLQSAPEKSEYNEIYVSAKNGTNITKLKEMLAHLAPKKTERKIVGDLLKKGDTVVLVTPIDEAAPKGRLILPQQQTIRDILDANATCVVCQTEDLAATLEGLKNEPKLVITDSQAFGAVSKIVPNSTQLTSFSILFARYKGELQETITGANKLENLKTGDTVLISEGCTHHRQCGDIGTVKLPAWINAYTKSEIKYEFTSGGDFPRDLSKYALIVHCGGCMLTETEMKNRVAKAKALGVPIVNYGIAIAKINGILDRAIKPLVK